ncbi:MAG: phage capsid protein [Burkholderiaceae bacterium]|nr:phage capsid protein [Burkholderiaceae bacterium]
MATRPFPIDPKLTAIAIAYRNPDVALIADDVLPRTPVAQEFKYLKYDLGQGFTVPDLKVGRKSYPAEVEFNATEVQDKVVDYGLDDFVPNEDIEADNQGVDPRGMAVAYLTNLINLGREIRAANLVFNTNSYVAGNQVTLSGTGQWSDEANANPVSAIGDALDIPIYRPNIAVFGQAAWTKTRRHPKLVQAIKGTAQGAGMVSRQEFADFFELSAVYVGAGFMNTAKKGQTVTTARVWGKHAAFLYRDRAAGPQAGVTFGFTAAWGDKISGSMPDQKRGLTGGEQVRVGERVKELVTATDLGYWFQNAVA